MKKCILSFMALGLLFSACHQKNNSNKVRVPSNQKIHSVQQKYLDRIKDMILEEVEVKGNKNNILEVSEKIQKYIEQANTTGEPMPVVNMFLPILTILPELEGIIWRMRKIVQVSDISHLSALKQLRSMQAGRYLYGKHVEAVFHYLTSPSKKYDYFKSIDEVQSFVYRKVAPVLKTSLKHLNELEKLESKYFEVDLDLALLVGQDYEGSQKVSFLDPDRQHRRFIKPYIYTLMAGIENTLGFIHYSSVYNWNDLFNIFQRITFLSGVNSIKNRITNILTMGSVSLPKSISLKEIVKILERYPNFGKARKNANKNDLKLSLQYFTDSYRHRLMGYTCSIDQDLVDNGSQACLSSPRSDFYPEERAKTYIVNPNTLLINKSLKYNQMQTKLKLFEEANEYYQDESKNNEFSTIISEITGQPVKLRIHRLFEFQTDLKKFLPTAANFDSSKRGKYEFVNNKKVWVWDYTYGIPKSLPDPSFNGFLVDVEKNSNSYISTLRTIKRTRATSFLGNVLITTQN